MQHKIVVNHRYTYVTNLDLAIGDTVVLPTPDYLRDIDGDEWIGTVTALTSDYNGKCATVIGKAS